MSTLKPRPPRDPEEQRLNEESTRAMEAYSDADRAYYGGYGSADELTAARAAYKAAEAAYNASYRANGSPR